MLCEMKDPAIKLFGKTIPLKETQILTNSLFLEKSDQDCQSFHVDSQVKHGCREQTKEDNDAPVAEDCSKPENSSICDVGKEENQQTHIPDNNDHLATKPEGNQLEDDKASQEKVLKKPDKIIPCPRCNSLDTKFCYYNNYNVSQPRHFCRNCQRYWTAGGTMRNVPVGAGRRKNKHLDPQCRQLMISSGGISASQVDKCSEVSAVSTPLCESMANTLNLDEHKKDIEMGPLVCIDDGEDPSSCGSSITASSSRNGEFPHNIPRVEHGGLPGSCVGLTPPTHPMQFYPGPPWAYPWNSGWNNVVPVAMMGHCSSDMVSGPESGNPNPAQWVPTSIMAAAPVFCPQTVPFPFVPPTYWSCMPTWPTGAWNVPWAGPTSSSIAPTSSTSNSGCSGNCSPTLLGKHSRDVNPEEEKKPEKCLWAPKTLRIDDPDDAAKSSIWATLGIKPDQDEPGKTNGVFKAFQPKTDGKCHTLDAAQVLRANPAAYSRSQSFQEST